ncbi:hypothetical protein [Mycolicibacterium sp. CR10]|uniref:hypothetical protein n=1 Tax=Mycolicibacterium sp. CR10 TaxID=2562314 RepID=UPI0010BFC843|nr:hypothetical protein [Mycolicibacterium sp. CR10]
MNAAVALGLNMTTAVLAQEEPRQTGPDFGKASPFGLIVVVLLLIGTFALVWSMNRHLKKLPKSFDTENPEADQAPRDGTLGTDPGLPTAHPTDNPADGTKREPG